MNTNPSGPYQPLPQPPDDAMPGQADLTILLGIAGNIAVGLNRFRVWPSGFHCILSVRVGVAEGPTRLPHPHFRPGRANGPQGTPVTAVLGVEYADGTAGDSGPPPPDLTAAQSAARITVQSNGSGVNGWFDIMYWITPLPPPGPITFWFHWQGAAMPRLTGRIDAEPLRRAATAAVELWC